jgi:hypothetical protein
MALIHSYPSHVAGLIAVEGCNHTSIPSQVRMLSSFLCEPLRQASLSIQVDAELESLSPGILDLNLISSPILQMHLHRL